MYKVPKRHRPRVGHFKQFVPGYHLHGGFFDDIRQIDSKLHLIWHPYRVEYDNVMNIYEGEEEDPRFCIHEEHGEEVWGWILRNPDNSPIIEARWHIWQIHDHGWSHVCPILSSHPEYLERLARRLHLQGRMNDKYGKKAYVKNLSEESEARREKRLADLQDLEAQVQKENNWLLRKAMENFERGVTAPTNPTKETIYSTSGQKSKRRLVRALDDEEGGLIVPESY